MLHFTASCKFYVIAIFKECRESLDMWVREFKGLRSKVFDEDDMGEEAAGEEGASYSSKSTPLPVPGTSEKKSDEVTTIPTDPNPQVRITGEISLQEIKGVLEKSLEKI